MKTIPIIRERIRGVRCGRTEQEGHDCSQHSQTEIAEAQVIVLYYARAIRIIRLYHTKGNDREYLKTRDSWS